MGDGAAIAARIMGFDPLRIGSVPMCHERALDVADPRDTDWGRLFERY